MDLIKDRGHYNSPVSFDPVQQRFCPAEEEQIRHQENFPVCHFSVHKISSKITVFIWTWSASKRNNSLNKEGNRYFIGGGCVPRLPTLLLFSWGEKTNHKVKTCTYHPSVASIWASKMATTSAVACSQPDIRDCDKPICCVCLTFFNNPGISLLIWSM